MSAQLTPEQIAKIRASRHLPQRDIAKLAGCSLASVSRTLKSAPPATVEPLTAIEPAGAVVVEPDAVAVAEHLLETEPSNEAALRASLVRLQKAGTVAATAKDVARMVSVERAVAQVLALLEKIKPPPVEDPNEAPDMIEAAKRFRTRAHSTLDRILEGVPR